MKTKTLLLLAKTFAILLLIINLTDSAKATTSYSYTWTGNAHDQKWTSSGNWSSSNGGATYPGNGTDTGDVVIINIPSGTIKEVPKMTLHSLTVSANCTLGSSDNIDIVTISTTLSVSTGITLIFGNGEGYLNLTLPTTATGTINGTVTIGETFTNNGILIMPSTGVINGTNGKFTLSSGATLEIGSTAGITSSGSTGNIQVTGARSYSTGANYIYNGTASQITGTGLPTPSLSGPLSGSLTINNSGSGATVTLSQNLTISSGGSITVDAGAFTLASSATVTISNGGIINMIGGTFAAGNYLTMSTTSTINSSGGSMTGTLQGSGVYNVTYTGSTRSTGSELSGSGLNNVTINLTSGQTLTAGASLTIGGNITIGSGATFNDGGYTHNIAGNWYNNGGTFTSTGTINFNGTGVQTIGGSSVTTFNTVTINNTTGVTLGIRSTITTLNIGNSTSNSVFNDGGYTISTASNLNLSSGTYNCSASTLPWGTLSASSGTTVNYGASGTQTIANQPYYNLTISGSGTKTVSGSGSLAVSSNLTINSPAILDVPSTNSLSVNGTLSSPGTSNLILESDASGTANLMNGTSSVPGTMKRYMSINTSNYAYHYLSSPISNATGSNIFTGNPAVNHYNAYKYTSSPASSPIWVRYPIKSTDNLTVGSGYAVPYYQASGGNTTLTFAGTLNTGSFSVPIGAAGNANLLGNPYPCNLSINSFLTNNSNLNGVYFWDDNGTGTGYQSSDYANCNSLTCSAGNQQHVPNLYISSGQGFMTLSLSTGNAIFNQNMEYTGNNNQFFSFIPEITNQVVRLNLTNDTNSFNQLIISFNPQATKGVDRLFDAQKFIGNANIAFYSLMPQDTHIWAIQAYPYVTTNDTFKLGYITTYKGNHTIKLGGLENIDNSMKIYLKDLKTNNITDLTLDSMYNFTSDKGTYNNRFIIIFNNPLPVAAGQISGINEFCMGQQNIKYFINSVANASYYDWRYTGTGAYITGSDTSVTVDFSTNATPGYLVVSGKNSGGEGDSSIFNITVKPLPSQPIMINGPTSVCIGEKNVAYNISNTSNNATSYIWNLPSFASGNSNTSTIYVDFGTKDTMGTIQVNGVNACGTGLPQSLIVMVNPIPATPVITLDANTNTLNSSSASGYQWYDENGVIKGATNQTYTPTVPGNYYVIVTTGACPSDHSNIISYSVTSISPASQPVGFDIYPNPANDKVIVKTNTALSNNSSVEIYSIEGHLILQNPLKNTETEIAISTLPKGMYIISIINDSKVERHQLIKQ